MKKTEAEAIQKAIVDGIKVHAKDVQVNIRKSAYKVLPDGTPLNLHRILFKKSSEASPLEKEIQKWNDDCLFAAALMAKRNEPLENRIRVMKHYQDGLERFSSDANSEFAKAMNTGGAGVGAEWIPTGFSAQVIELIDLELKVAKQHPRYNMTTNPEIIGGLSSHASVEVPGETTDATATAVGTRQITLTAKELVSYIPVTYAMTEDAAFSMIPIIRADIVTAFAQALENATINGDTSGTHMDSDVTNAKDIRKHFNGYRKLVLSAARQDLSTLTYENVVNLKRLIGKFGSDRNKIFWVTGPLGIARLTTLKDQNNNPVFFNRVVQNDPFMGGNLPFLLGAPVIESDQIREDLAATGYYTGTGNATTELIIVRKDAFIYGDRRNFMIETDKNIISRQNLVVASQRIAFRDRLDAANNTVVGVGYGIA